MRLVLDITRTSDGRYEGSLVGPGAAGRQDFVGILELLAILEQQLQPQGHQSPGPIKPDGGTNADKAGWT
jgi:hypothetical protein